MPSQGIKLIQLSAPTLLQSESHWRTSKLVVEKAVIDKAATDNGSQDTRMDRGSDYSSSGNVDSSSKDSDEEN